MPPSRPQPPRLPAAPTPFSPQKFYEPPVPPELQQITGEEDGDWWTSNACFAVAAAALTLFPIANRGTKWIYPQYALPTLVTEDVSPAPLATTRPFTPPPIVITDDEVWVAPAVSFSPDEDYYTVTVQQQYPLAPQAFTDDDVPAGSLYAPPDEVAWAPFAALQWPFAAPTLDDVVIVPQPVVLQPDEDFWQWPPPVSASLVPFIPWQDEQTPALTGQPDEDLWWNQVPLQQFQYISPLPWAGDEQTPALYGVPDEVLWWNQTAPVLQAFLVPNPWFHQDDPAGSLYGPPDDVFWNPAAIQSWPVVQPFTDDETIVPQPGPFSPDEDLWLNFTPPPPWPFTRLTLWIYPQVTAPYGIDELHDWRVFTQQQWNITPAFTDDEIITTIPVPPPPQVITILRWGLGSRMEPPYNP